MPKHPIFAEIETHFAYLIDEYKFKTTKHIGPVGMGYTSVVYESQDRNICIAVGLELDNINIDVTNISIGKKDISTIISELEGHDLRDWIYSESLKANYSRKLSSREYMNWQIETAAQRIKPYMPILINYLRSFHR